MTTPFLKYFSVPEKSFHLLEYVQKIKENYGFDVTIKSEHCFYTILKPGTDLDAFHKQNFEKLKFLFSHNPLCQDLSTITFLNEGFVVEIGPR